MVEACRSEEMRLALLAQAARRREPTTLSYLRNLLRRELKIDQQLAAKVYHLEIRPHLIELASRGLIDQARFMVSAKDPWFIAIRPSARKYLEARTAKPLAVVIREQLCGYTFQRHFLTELDQTNRPKRKSAPSSGRKTKQQVHDPFDEPFDPTEIIDERERAIALVVQRQGQSAFREKLLEIYEYRCAITGCDAVDALEAAHITPYQGEKTNHPANGLILRADLHALFDLGLLAIDSATMSVRLAPQLMQTSYRELASIVVRQPTLGAYQTSKKSLDLHRSWAESSGRWNLERGNPQSRYGELTL